MVFYPYFPPSSSHPLFVLFLHLPIPSFFPKNHTTFQKPDQILPKRNTLPLITRLLSLFLLPHSFLAPFHSCIRLADHKTCREETIQNNWLSKHYIFVIIEGPSFSSVGQTTSSLCCVSNCGDWETKDSIKGRNTPKENWKLLLLTNKRSRKTECVKVSLFRCKSNFLAFHSIPCVERDENRKKKTTKQCLSLFIVVCSNVMWVPNKHLNDL